MKVASFLVLAFTTCVLSAEPDKTCDEKDGTCLDTGTLPDTTKPSERQALFELYNSVGTPEAMKNWGDEDPCNGEKAGEFDQGFAYWQGIACRACSDPDEDYLCVRSIFLHQKDMNGPIPSSFVGFQDLEILLMSDNNLTGSLPTGMLSSCPKLRRVDLSYNKITGTLPLADMEGLVDLRQAFFDNNKFTTISEPPTPPFISGYENLMELNLNYNRDMNAPFPIAIAYMPKLSYMKIHDTKLKGILPTNNRAFVGVEMLQISGSTICGDALPAVCDPANTVPGRFEGAFCDLPSVPACDRNILLESIYPTPPPIRLACPSRSYGIVSLEIYRQVLANLGYEIEVITNEPHADIYPKFLQSPRSSETVDILVTSDLPHNHDRFLVGHEDMFVLAGTSYEAEMITIVVPDSAPYTTLGALSAAAPGFATQIIYTFDELACPVCKEDAEKWRDDYFTGFTVQAMSYDALAALVTEHQDDSEFIVVSWIPHGFNAQYKLRSIDMQAEEAKYLNQGKALIRKDSIYKMGPAGMGVLSAIMVPTKDVEQMDFQVTQGASPQDVAAAWITKYADIVNMWSWN